MALNTGGDQTPKKVCVCLTFTHVKALCYISCCTLSHCNNEGNNKRLTWTWSQQVSELLLITGMNKVVNTLTQQLQLYTAKDNNKCQ